jgi:hypothetical protein
MMCGQSNRSTDVRLRRASNFTAFRDLIREDSAWFRSAALFPWFWFRLSDPVVSPEQ